MAAARIDFVTTLPEDQRLSSEINVACDFVRCLSRQTPDPSVYTMVFLTIRTNVPQGNIAKWHV